MKFNSATTAISAGTALASFATAVDVAPATKNGQFPEYVGPSSPQHGVLPDPDGDEPQVEAARTMIAGIIAAETRVNLAAKFVRMGFHDCVGGCDGCIDLSNGDNAGLDVPIAALEPVVETFAAPGFTRADIWALAALQGASGSQPPANPENHRFTLDALGRANCEDANEASECVEETCNSQTRGPDRHLPSPDLDTHELLAFFADNFGFDERDTVAIMGSHTLGGLARENSGFDGKNGWIENTKVLSNGYYGALMGGTDETSTEEELVSGGPDWEQVYVDNSEIGTPSRWEWERDARDKHYVMVNSDVALVRDLADNLDDEGQASCQFKACPSAAETLYIAAEYKGNNAIWLEDFEDAFKRMLSKGLTGEQRVASVARRDLGALRGGQD